MVYIENLISALPMTMLACMPVTPKNVFTDIPKFELLSLLVFPSTHRRILYLLNVKRCSLDDDVCNRQYLVRLFDNCQVSLYFVFYRRCEPSFVFGRDPVVEAWLAITKSAPARSSLFSTCRELIHDVVSQLYIGGV